VVTGFDATSTNGHVVFITAITTVINSITKLVARYTAMIFTLESLECITTKVHWKIGNRRKQVRQERQHELSQRWQDMKYTKTT
jgi:hypothetical protein